MREWQNRNKESIYLDYQASTPVDCRVISAVEEYNYTYPANPHAIEHAHGWKSHEAIEQSSAAIADSIHVDADEIVFTSGATESNNLAVLGLARRAPSNRRRILVSAIEHKSILASARAVSQLGFQIDVIPVTAAGVIDTAELKERLADDVLLVSVMAVNNEIGSIQPLKSIADAAHHVGAVFHTDAVHLPALGTIDMEAYDVDLASFSAHKVYGPKGIGCLYVRRELHDKIEPLMYGGGQQLGLRPGTLPVPLCVGFGVAMGLMVNADAVVERERISELRNQFVERLQQLYPIIRLNGPSLSHRHPGNANLCLSGIDAQELLSIMQPMIAAATGSACSSGNPEPSHVLRALGMSIDDAKASLRFGIGRYTSGDEIDRAIALISDALLRYQDLGEAPRRAIL